MSYAIQSNSIRGPLLRDIADRTISEIYDDIKGMLGPGAVDAFITKDGSPYYTRDGKEVLESLIFDNELSNYIHHILYQAAYHQGQEIGDGSTTLAVLYCVIYITMRQYINNGRVKVTINTLRAAWKNVMAGVIHNMETHSTEDLNEDNLLSMLYTCTQDEDLAAKLFHHLKDPIMAGAYIVPRKSNIAADFRITTYNRPVIPSTKVYSLKPIKDKVQNSVVLYCNGMLDIAHTDVIAQIVTKLAYVGSNRLDLTVIILCYGVTEATRRTLREFNRELQTNGWDINMLNNLAIYTMDEYRKMEQAEIEDISTIITDEPGIGGLVNALTFEHLLYHVFRNDKWEAVADLETFDIDPHCVEKMREMLAAPYEVMFDDVEGMAIGKTFGPVATARYNELVTEIAKEKSSIRKHSLNKRLRRSFGMFIDIEVGSSLLKDSQRKYELILDAILSGSTAAKEKVVRGNSLLVALRAILTYRNENHGNDLSCLICSVMADAIETTLNQLIYNFTRNQDSTISVDIFDKARCPEQYNITDFTFNHADDDIWPAVSDAMPIEPFVGTVEDADGSSIGYTINRDIVEPFGSIKAILENSTLPVELAMAEVFHISARTGFMNNFIQESDNDVR